MSDGSETHLKMALLILGGLAGGFIAYYFTGRDVYLAGTFFVVHSALAIDGINRGEVSVRGRTFRRDEPRYWLFVLMYATFAVACAAWTWLTWDAPVASPTGRR